MYLSKILGGDQKVCSLSVLHCFLSDLLFLKLDQLYRIPNSMYLGDLFFLVLFKLISLSSTFSVKSNDRGLAGFRFKVGGKITVDLEQWGRDGHGTDPLHRPESVYNLQPALRSMVPPCRVVQHLVFSTEKSLCIKWTRVIQTHVV